MLGVTICALCVYRAWKLFSTDVAFLSLSLSLRVRRLGSVLVSVRQLLHRCRPFIASPTPTGVTVDGTRAPPQHCRRKPGERVIPVKCWID